MEKGSKLSFLLDSNSPILKLPKNAVQVQDQKTLLLSSLQDVFVISLPKSFRSGKVKTFLVGRDDCISTDTFPAPRRRVFVIKLEQLSVSKPHSL